MHTNELDRAITQSKWGIAIVLTLFLFLAVAASVINPLHEATDELRHYRFVRQIAQEGSLPVQGEMACSAQGHHPPLFYGLAALATFWIDTGQGVCVDLSGNPFWAYRYWEVGHDNKTQYLHTAAEQFPWAAGALAAHLARFVNVILGAATVYLTWLIGRAIWRERPFLALGSAAFIAFNPMFVYLSGAINNDIIAALSGAAITLACVRLVTAENGLSRRWGVAFGLLYSLALMSKFNLAAIALLVAVAMTWVAWRKKQWRLWLEMALIIGGIGLLLTGWWFARNQLLYGEPTGVQRLTELWGVRNPAESWGLALYELPYVWTSLWGRFGYGQIPLPDGVYAGLRWLALLAGLGYLIPVMRRQTAVLKTAAAPLLLLALNVLLFFAVVFNYLLISPAGPMGRFFFPALPALAVLLFFGLRHYFWWADARLQQTDVWTAIVANVGMASLTVVAIFGFLRAAYAPPATFAANASLPHASAMSFGELVTLRGYAVESMAGGPVYPGDPIDLTLYWEVTGQPPGDYLFFVHLIDETGMIVGQRDTHPGLGNFPSSQWQVGDRFVEHIRLYVPETAYTPATTQLSIGFYAPEGYRLGVTDEAGAFLGDALVLETVNLALRNADLPNELNINFNNKMNLAGYTYNKRIFKPGDVFELRLFWQPLTNTLTEYQVSVRFRDEAGNEAAIGDGRFPTEATDFETWSPGMLIESRHLIALSPSFAPGVYTIEVQLFEPGASEPEAIRAEDGHVVHNRLSLSDIRIEK